MDYDKDLDLFNSFHDVDHIDQALLLLSSYRYFDNPKLCRQ